MEQMGWQIRKYMAVGSLPASDQVPIPDV